jgi:hypothetical protein
MKTVTIWGPLKDGDLNDVEGRVHVLYVEILSVICVEVLMETTINISGAGLPLQIQNQNIKQDIGFLGVPLEFCIFGAQAK